MDIVSRLKAFLQRSGINNSQFADTCEIPRPTLSQLLNGRNKKVSDELISKIHRAYPGLNIMWLMFGDGDMFVPNENYGATSAPAQLDENANRDEHSATSKAISFGDDVAYQQPQPAAAQKAMNDAFESIVRSAAAPRRGAARPAAPIDGERKVVSIMVLYSDGRFETFSPQH